MNFNIRSETISSNSLSLKYNIIPWDSELFSFGVVDITEIFINDYDLAKVDIGLFDRWCIKNNVKLACTRLSQDDIKSINFLEANGFNFIEMNYSPFIRDLQSQKLLDTDFIIDLASNDDIAVISRYASTIFKHGRYHQDELINNDLANQRYANWVINASKSEHQYVYKCIDSSNKILGFFIIEFTSKDTAFLSLVGMAPEFSGRGLGKLVWSSMLHYLKHYGVNNISTSISSHNLPVFNLYVSLNFRFPEPTITLHKWYK